MGTLKESIQHEVCLLECKSLDHVIILERKVESKNMATRRVVTNNYRENHVLSPSLTKPTRLTPYQMYEIREKGICFNCDNKYNKGHKCGEKKLFYILCEEEEDQELEASHNLELEETAPMIYFHTLAGIITPKPLNIEGYIKNKKVIVLLDSSSTHNFINYKLEKLLNWFVFPAPKFQVMIAYGGTTNFSLKFYSIKLNMGGIYWIVPFFKFKWVVLMLY
jgi:hypothetical protein